MREIKRGDVYYADLSPVLGSEQGGLRPVLVIQNDTGNKYSPTTIVAAITSKRDKANIPTHVSIRVEGLSKSSIVLLEQIRTIDKSRIRTFVNDVDGGLMDEIDEALLISIGLSNAKFQMEGDGQS